MDSNKIKSILRLYRPDVDEETKPISEALAQVESDPELNAWYKKHLENESAISAQLNDIAIPIDLKTQLKKQYAPKNTTSRRKSWLAPLALAASILLLVLSWGKLSPLDKPNFVHFQQDMIAFATQPYEMDILVEDLDSINKGFAKAGWPTNYTTPKALNSLHALGGVTQEWENEKVSIVCLEDEAGKYIWLFITKLNTFGKDRAVILNAKLISEVPLLTHASWQDQTFTYYMIAEGDVEFINSYL
ncbi:hypothetical protein [Photobacterium lutimaris]|uniref:Uncharacterized protein n=1 Tax=Photobacterium lutimaris TaxID=388278 RepID=A0A2T3IZE3_9GAMM|nr:hypothetical protein [Photobacterium lutimaris]PSU34026.1 hypothetical protein C9I99_11745 [Photobacterium lutimaris]TDR76367.1 hypothetical protein DFP78_103364 [Photobacterium lutimaris]